MVPQLGQRIKVPFPSHPREQYRMETRPGDGGVLCRELVDHPQEHRAETLDDIIRRSLADDSLDETLDVASLVEEIVDGVKVFKHPAQQEYEVANRHTRVLFTL